MSIQERYAFEEAMQRDETLRQAVEDFPLAQMISGSIIEEDVRSVLADVKREGENRSRWIKWVVIFFIAALITFVIRWNFEGSKNEMLYAEVKATYYEYPENAGSRSLIPGSSKLDSSIYYFDLGNFKLSKKMFQTMDPNEEIVMRYLGHIAFEEKDFVVSKILFTDLKNKSSFPSEANEMLFYLSYINGSADTTLLSELPSEKQEKLKALLR